jgi:phosphatidylserine synthase
MGLKDRLVDPNSPERRPRRAAYALPTLFTAGNIFLGFLAILRAFHGAMAGRDGRPRRIRELRHGRQGHRRAVFLDGLDGRIARMTNTTSDFGREMDSLADVISSALPRPCWPSPGACSSSDRSPTPIRGQIHNAGYFISFLFLLCGAVRLARFNVQKNPVPKNPGRPDRKYFVGLPIPAGAGMVAAVVYRRQFRSHHLVAAYGSVARAAAAARLPHGQHLALLQFQGHQPQQALYAAHPHRTRSVYLRHVELLAAHAARDGHGICRQRNRDSHRRRHPQKALLSTDWHAYSPNRSFYSRLSRQQHAP